MVRIKISMVCLLGLMVSAGFFLTAVTAEESSSQAEAQVSHAIAEWKLLNDDEAEKERPICPIDSLRCIVGQGLGQEAGLAKELAAFERDYYSIRSQVKDWELKSAQKIGNRYITQLPTMADAYRNAAGALTINGIGWAYGNMAGSAIYGVASTTIAAPIAGMETINTLGRSMQIMNPPIYLDTRAHDGLTGEGLYQIKGGHIYYQEKLKTNGPTSITRTHMDWGKTNTETYYRYTEINTPVSNNLGGKFERFATNRWPVGSQWDPQFSTEKTIEIQKIYRIETASKIHKMPTIQTGDWNITAENWNNIGKWNSNIGMSSYGTTIGKISTTMPNYSPLPTKMPTYTSPNFKMPSYKSTSGSGIK